MAGYSSGDDWEDREDDDYCSDGGWGDEQEDGDYYSDNHHEQQDFDDYDSVDGELHYEERDSDEIPYDHLEDFNNVTESYEETDSEYSYCEEEDDNDESSYEGSYEETDSEYSYYEEEDDNDESSYEGSYEETDSDDNYCEEEQDEDDMTSDYEYQGEEAEESDEDPEGHLGGYGAVKYPQQTMTRGIVNNQDDGGGRSVMGYQWSSRIRHQDKQTNSYELTNTKHTFSSGDKFKERSTGRVGFKDEQKWSSTIRVGDRNGYSEHQLVEVFRNIRFGDNSRSGSTTDGHRLTSNNYKKY